VIINRGQTNITGVTQQKGKEKCDGCPGEKPEPKDSFVSGLKLGLAYTLDPVGVAMETAEEVLVDGKGPKDNTFKSAFMEVAGDVHKDQSLSRYLGQTVGVLTGGAMQAATGGAIAAVTGLVSFGAGLFGFMKTLSEPGVEKEPEKPKGDFGKGFSAGFGIAVDPFGVTLEKADSLLVSGEGMHENTFKTVAEDMTEDAHRSKCTPGQIFGAVAGAFTGAACNVITGGALPVATGIIDIFKTLFD